MSLLDQFFPCMSVAVLTVVLDMQGGEGKTLLRLVWSDRHSEGRAGLVVTRTCCLSVHMFHKLRSPNEQHSTAP